jgi:hypothetical protein
LSLLIVRFILVGLRTGLLIVAIVVGVNVWILRTWTIELLEEMIQSVTLFAYRLHHVVPNSIRTHSVTFLTQMNTINRHDGQVRFCVLLIKDAGVFKEWLIDDSEVIGMKLMHETDFCHDIDKSSFNLSEQFSVL